MKALKGAFLPYLEVHLADGCNLNCLACSHFSPLCNHLPLPDSKTIISDLRRVNQLFQVVGHLRFLGGEPLLNPELPFILEEFRRIMPFVKCTLVTNGLLLERWGTGLMNTLKRNNITLCITGYQCNQEIGSRMEALYRSNGNKVLFTPQTEFFRLFLNSKGRNIGERCELQHCTLLREGHLYRCSISAMIFAYNHAFAQEYPQESGINIYDISDGSEALELLRRPGQMCKYCSDCGMLRKWGYSLEHTAEEWCADQQI